MFKIRYSYGKVGNDNLGNTRFPYLYDIETMTKKDGDKTVDTGGYNFGDYTFDRYYGGMRYSSLSSPNVTWEIATKHDLGIDFSFSMTTYPVLLTILMRNAKESICYANICRG